MQSSPITPEKGSPAISDANSYQRPFQKPQKPQPFYNGLWQEGSKNQCLPLAS